MTALDFARKNLFELLGIRQVVWPADPQRVTRGWYIIAAPSLDLIVATYGAPQGLRGYWADARTVVLEYAGTASNDHCTIHFRFEGEQVVVDAQETAHALAARFTGRLRP